jgi:outer membrane protein assembly factor BamB
MVHFLNVAHGLDVAPPVKFLPPNANAHGLILVEDVVYAGTTGGCGGAADGIWALDLPTQQVAVWKSKGGVAGSAGPAMGPDGTLYVATTEGELAALEPKTLRVKDTYKVEPGFTSSPVIFEYQGKTLLAAAAKDGRIHLLDTARLAALHRTAVYSESPDFIAGALASWTDAGGARWIAAPAAHAVVACKVVDRDGAPALDSGWESRGIVSPLPPIVINGVVFAASGGSSPAVFYALDGSTGKELWSSGATVTSPARGGLSGGGSQVYLGTQDGTLYAFGFPIEH